jgi:helicase
LVYGLRGCVDQLNSVGLIAAAQLTNELNDIYMPVNLRGKKTEIPRWPNLLAQQGVPWQLINALQQTSQDARQATTRAKRASAAVLWVTGMPIEDIERYLNQHMYNRGGLAGTVRAIADRTRDLLPAVAAVVRSIDATHAVDDLAARTMLRLEIGIPAELVDLADSGAPALQRHLWMKLHAAGLVAPEAILGRSTAELESALGDRAAAKALRRHLQRAIEGQDLAPLQLPEPTE